MVSGREREGIGLADDGVRGEGDGRGTDMMIDEGRRGRRAGCFDKKDKDSSQFQDLLLRAKAQDGSEWLGR